MRYYTKEENEITHPTKLMSMGEHHMNDDELRRRRDMHFRIGEKHNNLMLELERKGFRKEGDKQFKMVSLHYNLADAMQQHILRNWRAGAGQNLIPHHILKANSNDAFQQSKNFFTKRKEIEGNGKGTKLTYTKEELQKLVKISLLLEMDSNNMTPKDHLRAIKRHKKHFHFWDIAADMADKNGNKRLAGYYYSQRLEHGSCMGKHETAHEVKTDPSSTPERIDWENSMTNRSEKNVRENKKWIIGGIKIHRMHAEHDEIMKRTKQIMKEDEERRNNPIQRRRIR